LKTGNTLSAAERIKSRKLFESLFKNRTSIKEYPFRLVYKSIDFDPLSPVKIAVSVPSKNMSLAVNRNRMKRLMREAYRLNKHALITYSLEKKKGVALLFVALMKEPCSFRETQEKINLLLQRLISLNDKIA
jgi:ribonuclease P protein component